MNREFIRSFNSYEQVIELITYMIDDKKGIEELEKSLINEINDDRDISFIIEVQVVILHYKNQIEISIRNELEKESFEHNNDVLEQIYTMLQRIEIKMLPLECLIVLFVLLVNP